jgi:hypothetical protein
LEPLFAAWEEKWHRDGRKDINNPKIPVIFVVQNGTLVFGAVPDIRTGPRKIKPPIDDMFEVDE